MQVVPNMQAKGAEAFVMPSTAIPDRTIEPKDSSISDLVAAAQSGSSAAFEELHATYSRRLYRTILSITKNSHDAEEALQDALLRAYLAIKTFKGKSTIYSWLTRIAINSALMILRKRRVRSEVLFDPQPNDRGETIAYDVKDSAPNPEELCMLHQYQHRTLHAINRLRPYLRTPLRMQVVHGLSIKEISRALNVSEASVKSRLYRARLHLSGSHGTVLLRQQSGSSTRREGSNDF
jgi:RNA polymerase sigma-70 factor (ECF subfamily)